MKQVRTVKRLGCLGFLLLPSLGLLVVFTLLFHSTTSSNDCSVSTSLVVTVSSVVSDTDWTKEGSTAYNNAKLVFDSWVSKGLSGTSAAGIIGWANSEGGFSIVDRAEGHYGTD